MTGSARRLAIAVALGWTIAGCGPSVTGSAPPGSVPPGPTVPAALSSPVAATPPPAASPSMPEPSAGGAAVILDRELLAILPPTVGDLPVLANPEGEAAALGDPILASVGLGVAVALAIDPAGGDFVYVVVARLRPEALTDEAFRDWRDSFDEGACSQADGVVGRAETEVDGRTVYIGTCAGGLRTYHVRVEDRDVLISASAAGERRLGELLVENLRPKEG